MRYAPTPVHLLSWQNATNNYACSIENDTFFGKQKKIQMETGAAVLPHFTKDNTDRNRTSPFAFTGNKFEFRMPGSALSVSGPNIVLNTAVAEALRQFYEELKDVPADKMDEVEKIINSVAEGYVFTRKEGK